jgi:hypothetical protein
VLVKLLKDNGYQRLLPAQYIDDSPCDVCCRLLSVKETCEVLKDLIDKDAEFRLRTEYGRQYYLSESEMIKE